MEPRISCMKMPSYDELLKLFERVDTNHSGCISIEELQDALSVNTFRPFNKRALTILLELVDKNKSGTVNFDEFGALYKYIVGWLNWYQTFDFNGSGLLECIELKHSLTKLGYFLTVEETYEYIKKYDRSGTGKIDFDDFIVICDEISRRHSGPSVHDRIINRMIF